MYIKETLKCCEKTHDTHHCKNVVLYKKEEEGISIIATYSCLNEVETAQLYECSEEDCTEALNFFNEMGKSYTDTTEMVEDTAAYDDLRTNYYNRIGIKE